MTPGYRAIRFDELEDVPWKPGLTPEDALAIAEAGLAELGETPGTLYAMALALAAAGRGEESRQRLDEAIAREPELRHEAREDALLS